MSLWQAYLEDIIFRVRRHKELAEKLPHIRFHDLRHSAARLLLAAGKSPKIIQERLGHAKIETTLNIYAHVTPGMQQEAARKLDRLLG